MDGIARAALWTNQMGYITLIAQLPGIYGNVNPGQLGYNYYIISVATTL